MNALEIIETIFALEQRYKPEVFGIEEGQIEKAIGPILYEEMPKRGVFPNFVRLKPSLDKLTRARSISARMKAKSVKFDKNEDWYPNFEDECVKFPRDKHDDQVDAFAYLGLMLNKMVEAPSKIEIEEEEYANELRTSGFYELGRNAYTGY